MAGVWSRKARSLEVEKKAHLKEVAKTVRSLAVGRKAHLQAVQTKAHSQVAGMKARSLAVLRMTRAHLSVEAGCLIRARQWARQGLSRVLVAGGFDPIHLRLLQRKHPELEAGLVQ